MNCSKCININKCHEFSLSKEHLIEGISRYRPTIYDLLVFFLYLSPNTSSNLSMTLCEEKSEETLEIMLKEFKRKNSFQFTSNSLKTDLLREYSLSDDLLHSKCKRFICNVASKDGQNRLSSLMRHLRNSIAHGHFSIIQGGTYYRLFFEDKSKKGKITFRMVINHSTLKEWKIILSAAMKCTQSSGGQNKT